MATDRSGLRSSTRFWFLITGLCCCIEIIILCNFSDRQLRSLSITKAADFTMMHEVLWNTAHGKFFQTSALNGKGIGSTDHFSPALLLLVPFYLFTDSTRLTQFLVPLILVFTALPVYSLARRLLGSPLGGFLAAFTYLLLPEVHALALNGIYLEIEIVPILAITLLYFRRGNLGWFVIAALLTMMCREEFFIIIGLMAITEIVGSRRLAFILTPLCLAGAYGCYLKFGTQSFSGDRMGTALWLMGNMTFPIPAMVREIISFILSWSPLLWLCLFVPFRLLPGIPGIIVATILVKSVSPYESINFLPANSHSHYVLSAFPLMVMGALEVSARFYRRLHKSKLTTAKRDLLVTSFIGVVWIVQLTISIHQFNQLQKGFFTPNDDDKALWKAVKTIAPNERIVSNLAVPYVFFHHARLFMTMETDRESRRHLVVMDTMFDDEFMRFPERRDEIYQVRHVDWDRLGIMVRPSAFSADRPDQLKRLYLPVSPTGFIPESRTHEAYNLSVTGCAFAAITDYLSCALKPKWNLSINAQDEFGPGFEIVTSITPIDHDLTQVRVNLRAAIRSITANEGKMLPNVFKIVIFDERGDGIEDGLVAIPEAGEVWFISRIGAPIAEPPVRWFAESGLTDALPFDANNDKHYSLLVAAGNRLSLINPSDGTEKATVALTNSITTLLADDFDGDGKTELIAAIENGSLAIIASDSQDRLSVKNVLGSRYFITAMKAKDFDGDGLKDILAADLRTCSAIAWKNFGNSKFVEYGNWTMGPLSRFIDAIDLNNDGALDLVSGKSSIMIKSSELGSYLEYLQIRRALVDVSKDVLADWLDELGWKKEPLSDNLAWFVPPGLTSSHSMSQE